MTQYPVPPSSVKPYNIQSHVLKIDGIYQHYKGKLYKVLYVARHTETLEECVVYQALYDSFDIWIRPLEMFMGHLEIDGVMLSRFTLLEE